jgi:adenylylsulfate kinase
MDRTPKSDNITWHNNKISSEARAACLHQRGCVLWMTGLSGSGKSTIAVELEAQLMKRGYTAFVLDGDNIRHGLNADLDFSETGRHENIRRISHVAALLADAGMITITAFISPFAEDRAMAKTIINKTTDGNADRFREIYINTPLSVCETRDPKGLYKKARTGEITNFTGIHAPFEAPENPDLEVKTDNLDIDQCVEHICRQLEPTWQYAR